jgi:hypothetical protein
MRYTLRSDGITLGHAELHTGSLVAARLDPAASYASIQAIVREATVAFLRLGLFAAAVPFAPDEPADVRDARAAMVLAAALQLELLDARGERVPTAFINLLDAPADGGVVVLVCFDEAAAPLDVSVMSRRLANRWEQMPPLAHSGQRHGVRTMPARAECFGE